MEDKALDLFPEFLSDAQWTVFQRTGGDISSALGIRNESNGKKLFLKFNFDSGTRPNLFSGEFESLLAMRETECGITVPKPIAFCDNGILMEYIEMSSSKSLNEFDLGRQLAKMHLHNRLRQNPVDKFGFHVDTCCGALSFSNDWTEDWPNFYFKQRLGALVRKIQNCELNQLFTKLEGEMEKIFDGIAIVPSLVHGDMWSGNYSVTIDGKTTIYDPGAFYAHDEFEFGMIDLFGGLGKQFLEGYRTLIPEEEGFDCRVKLYKLFHLMNHWAHFCNSYKRSSLQLLSSLTK